MKKTAPELRSDGTSTGAVGGGVRGRCSLLMLTVIDLEDILGPIRATCVWTFLGWASNHTNTRSLAVLARHRMHRPYSLILWVFSASEDTVVKYQKPQCPRNAF